MFLHFDSITPRSFSDVATCITASLLSNGVLTNLTSNAQCVCMCVMLWPCHHQDRLDCSHAKVVMVLLGQLLRAQLVHLRHLPGEDLTGLKSLRVQDHLHRQRARKKGSVRCRENTAGSRTRAGNLSPQQWEHSWAPSWRWVWTGPSGCQVALFVQRNLGSWWWRRRMSAPVWSHGPQSETWGAEERAMCMNDFL